METEWKKNRIFTGEVVGYTSDGAGVVRPEDGPVTFVPGALRGETCEIRLLKVGRAAAWGKVEQVLLPSPHRTAPACPAARTCGGCALLHMDYEEELAFKRQKVQDAFARIGGLDVEVSAIHGAPRIEGYRNKAIFSFAMRDGAPAAGFFRPRSHDVVPADACRIQTPGANAAAAAVCRWMAKNGVPAYDWQTHTGAVRHVFCRSAADGALQATLVTAEPDLPDLDGLIAELRAAVPGLASVVLNENRTPGSTVLTGTFSTLWGADALEDTLCGLRFSLSPRSFYQVNREQAEALYEKALEYAGLTGRETVLDLYCGTGTITLCLARRAGRAIGAEIVADAVRDARENAARNGVSNAEFHCADAAEIAARLRAEGLRPDVITVDPPRKGLAPEVVDAVAGMAPDRVVYISCDCATLARDAARFAALGYAVRRAEAFDLFPRTAHVETVCLLCRQKKDLISAPYEPKASDELKMY